MPAFLVVLASSFSLTVAAPGPAPSPRPTLPLRLPSGTTLQAEVMRTPEETALGLMFRPSLPERRVLLFVFRDVEFHAIWMKNCRFPIDILWLDEDRRVVYVAETVPPCRSDPCPSYSPMRKALFVIEMNAGLARREKLTIGAVIDFNLDAPAR